MQIISLELNIGDGELRLLAEGICGAYDKGFETLLIDTYESIGEVDDLFDLESVCLLLNHKCQESFPEDPPVFGKLQLEKGGWKRKTILTYIFQAKEEDFYLPEQIYEDDHADESPEVEEFDSWTEDANTHMGCPYCTLPAGCDRCREETD